MLAAKIKDKLRAGGVSLGGWMSMAHVSVAEILASAGFEWIVVETEHTAIDVSEVLRLLIAIEGRGCVPLVRLAWNDPIQAKAVLDSGAAGIIVPMVNTRADAELAVRSAKYPPEGFRGAGLARAQGYGETFGRYVREANDSSLVMLQIEHIDAVGNIDDILSVPGVDGAFIGPYDLSMSMGRPGDIHHPEVQEAMDKVLAVARRHGVTAGIHLVHPSDATVKLQGLIAKGYQFFALGTDILLLGDTARNLHRVCSDCVVGRKTDEGCGV